MLAKLAIFFMFFVLGVSSSAKNQHQSGSELKLKQLSDLAAKSPVVTLDDSTYSYYAIQKPRPYSLIVYLTANHPKFKCGICRNIDSDIYTLAKEHQKELKAKGQEQTVFFVRLDFEQSQKVFQSYELTSVPLLFHLPPQDVNSDTKDYHILGRDKYQIPQDADINSVKTFISDRTGVSIKVPQSIWPYISMVIIFIIMAVLVQPIINTLPFWISLIQTKGIWMFISGSVYTCAISGLIFDIIRSPPMYYANHNTGQISYFYPQSGNQFVVEGFIIGFLNLICAIGGIYLVAYAPSFKDEQVKFMSVIGGLIAFFICFRMTRSLYIMKNPWYGARY